MHRGVRATAKQGAAGVGAEVARRLQPKSCSVSFTHTHYVRVHVRKVTELRAAPAQEMQRHVMSIHTHTHTYIKRGTQIRDPTPAPTVDDAPHLHTEPRQFISFYCQIPIMWELGPLELGTRELGNCV